MDEMLFPDRTGECTMKHKDGLDMAAVMLLCGALGGIFAANLRKFK